MIAVTEHTEGARLPDDRFGLRVALEGPPLESRELGSFDAVDTDGKLSVASLREELYNTTIDGVRALSYSISRREAGLFPVPKLWAMLSVFSGIFLISLLVFSFLQPDFTVGMPFWVYYLSLGIIFLVSSVMERKRIKQFLTLYAVHQFLAKFQSAHCGVPILDTPPGRVEEVRAQIQDEIAPLPPSKIPADQLQQGSSVAPSETGEQTDGAS